MAIEPRLHLCSNPVDSTGAQHAGVHVRVLHWFLRVPRDKYFDAIGADADDIRRYLTHYAPCPEALEQ